MTTAPPPQPVVDPRVGRITESRLGKGRVGAELAKWGAQPAAPASGAAWFEQFAYTPATLGNGLGTDQQWYALSYTSCLIRGFCNYAVIAEALSAEGVFPVGAVPRGKSEAMAMATIWFNLIHDSVCGSYHEVVLSFDVNHTRPDLIAFQEGGRVDATWALQYGNFGPSICDSQFLHSLWINSPLSIRWGREMQAFPKHPKPVASTLADTADAFAFDLAWDGQNVMRGRVAKRFGAGPFLRESLGLMNAIGAGPVASYLASSSIEIPITMPASTAAQNHVPRRYLAHLWKGLNPFAIQVWPWGKDDVLDLGGVSIPTGCEPHNGQALLTRAGFIPRSVTYLPLAAALVEVATTQ